MHTMQVDTSTQALRQTLLSTWLIIMESTTFGIRTVPGTTAAAASQGHGVMTRAFIELGDR